MGFKGKSIQDIWMIRKWRELLGKEEHKARQDQFNTDSIALRTLKTNINNAQSDAAFKAHWGYSNHKELPDIGPVEYAQSELVSQQNSQTALCCMLAMWNGNVHLVNNDGNKRSVTVRLIHGRRVPTLLQNQFEICLNKFCPDRVEEILEEYETVDWDEYRLEIEGKEDELEEYRAYKKLMNEQRKDRMWGKGKPKASSTSL